MSEVDMIRTFIGQITTLKSVKKVFMNKRDVKVYDNSWNNISESRTEYDVEIITLLIDPNEWQQIVALERDFRKRYPMFKFNYHIIESESNKSNSSLSITGKLIYDSDTDLKLDHNHDHTTSVI